ncbi:MAG: type II toxin-antitoxin system RelE/ParE family toxin [Oscillospiraceae bacterium]|nr:type II toxin-antitoxin system RelE/ParE family toxin [Oscillospiraceae bacterium]
MDEYSVKISSPAQNDFLEIAERIKMLPPEEVAQHFDSILGKTKVLATKPESCPYARDSQLRLRGYRMLTIDEYIYFFVIIEKNVIIRRILYARRQYDRLM